MSKKYLVIGASSGIGEELVNELLSEGNIVYTAQRNKPSIKNENLHFQEFDIQKSDAELKGLPEELDGLVYCPGTINLKPFNRLSVDDFKNDFEVNLIGAVKSIQGALKNLKKSKNASVILFSTVAVAQGMSFHASVASAKGAVEGLTKSLAAELSPNIRVNAIAPSVTDTPLASKILSSDERKDASAKRHPLQRYGESKDIAQLASFLLSDKGSWITGQIIGLDGGLSTVRNL
ncbi:MAG: SDR family oxidoreductase [Bacteroidota bacterium]